MLDRDQATPQSMVDALLTMFPLASVPEMSLSKWGCYSKAPIVLKKIAIGLRSRSDREVARNWSQREGSREEQQ